MPLTILLLSAVTLQRLGELVLDRRHTRRLLDQGAYEVGAAHYPLMLLLHTAWLGSLWLLGWRHVAVFGWLWLYLALQGLRLWVMASLGARWTTRIIILPGAPLVRRGPYRWISHPNYVVVAAEIAVLPLTLDLPGLALLFSFANAAVLFIRIRAENAGLMSAAEPAKSPP